MIRHEFTINNWRVHGFYIVSSFNLDELELDMILLGCKREDLLQAEQTMKNDNHNTGFTYSNLNKHESILVIGIADNDGETINTLTHEARHLQQHISIVYNLDQNSESVCYLLGLICQIIYEKFREENLL